MGKRDSMSTVAVGHENSSGIGICYEDHGEGRPVILIHGWPLSGAFWEKQVVVLVAAGHRVITYDRRGFGKSTRPMTGYNYDTLADDLHALITKLGLRDVALVGFSMGGGEVARYIAKYGSTRVSKAVFISSITPYLVKAKDNPEGVDGSVFEGMRQAIIADRPAFLSSFFSNFYNADVLKGKRISDQVIQYSWNVGVSASPKGTLECVSAWLTDFRKDLASVDVPTLIIHGDSDRICPHAATASRMPKAVQGAKLVILKDAPHGLIWTHADEVNKELVAFLK